MEKNIVVFNGFVEADWEPSRNDIVNNYKKQDEIDKIIKEIMDLDLDFLGVEESLKNKDKDYDLKIYKHIVNVLETIRKRKNTKQEKRIKEKIEKSNNLVNNIQQKKKYKKKNIKKKNKKYINKLIKEDKNSSYSYYQSEDEQENINDEYKYSNEVTIWDYVEKQIKNFTIKNIASQLSQSEYKCILNNTVETNNGIVDDWDILPNYSYSDYKYPINEIPYNKQEVTDSESENSETEPSESDDSETDSEDWGPESVYCNEHEEYHKRLYYYLKTRGILDDSYENYFTRLRNLRRLIRLQRRFSKRNHDIDQGFKIADKYLKLNTDIVLYDFILKVLKQFKSRKEIYITIVFDIMKDGYHKRPDLEDPKVEKHDSVKKFRFQDIEDVFDGLDLFFEFYTETIKEIEQYYDCDIISLSNVRITVVNERFTDSIKNRLRAYAPRDDYKLKKYTSLSSILGRETDNLEQENLCLYEAYVNTTLLNNIDDEILKKVFLGRQNQHTLKKRKETILNLFSGESEELKNIVKEGRIKEFIDYINNKYNKNVLSVYFIFDDSYYPSEDIENIIIYKDGHVASSTHSRISQYKKDKEEKDKKKKTINKYIMKPIDDVEDVEPENSFAWDIETFIKNKRGRQMPYVLCLYGRNGKIKNKFKGTDCVTQFLNYIHKHFLMIRDTKGNDPKKIPQFIFWTYNGANFDHLYIIKDALKKYYKLNYIGTPTSLKELSYHNIIFLDFCRIFGGGLNNLSKSWLGEEKKEFDVKKVTKRNYLQYIEEAAEYCLKDSELLYKLIMKYYELIKSIDLGSQRAGHFGDLAKVSAASLSVSIFRACFQEQNIYSSPPEIQEGEREAYFGGITILLKRKMLEGYYYDINSSYPSSMLSDMPFQFTGKFPLKKPKRDYKEFVDHYLYFVTFKFKESVKVPNLPVRTTTELKYPLMYDIISPRWGVELNTAFKMGCNITVYKYYTYEPYPVFKQYIETMYRERMKAKAYDKAYTTFIDMMKKDNTINNDNKYIYLNPLIAKQQDIIVKCKDNAEELEYQEYILAAYIDIERIPLSQLKNKSGEQKSFIDFFKLCMNSLYGKTGQKKYDRNIIGSIDRVREIIADKKAHLLSITWLNTDEPSEEPIYLATYDTDHYETEEIGTLVRFASFITASSRSKFIEGILDVGPENVGYGDTDSIMTLKPLSNDNIDNFILGKWKLEHKIYNAIFAGLKTYTYTLTPQLNGIFFTGNIINDYKDTLEKHEYKTVENIYNNFVFKSKGVHKNLLCYNDYNQLLNNKIIQVTVENQFFRKFGYAEVRDQTKLLKKSGNRIFINDELSFPVRKVDDPLIYKLYIESKFRVKQIYIDRYIILYDTYNYIVKHTYNFIDKFNSCIEQLKKI